MKEFSKILLGAETIFYEYSSKFPLLLLCLFQTPHQILVGDNLSGQHEVSQLHIGLGACGRYYDAVLHEYLYAVFIVVYLEDTCLLIIREQL